jgi:hypothetical protein
LVLGACVGTGSDDPVRLDFVRVIERADFPVVRDLPADFEAIEIGVRSRCVDVSGFSERGNYSASLIEMRDSGSAHVHRVSMFRHDNSPEPFLNWSEYQTHCSEHPEEDFPWRVIVPVASPGERGVSAPYDLRREGFDLWLIGTFPGRNPDDPPMPLLLLTASEVSAALEGR